VRIAFSVKLFAGGVNDRLIAGTSPEVFAAMAPKMSAASLAPEQYLSAGV
jgi:hypothetical protein